MKIKYGSFYYSKGGGGGYGQDTRSRHSQRRGSWFCKMKWDIFIKSRHIVILFESEVMSLEFNYSLPRRNPKRAGSIHHTPLPTPSMHSPPFSPVCRGEVSWDLLWTQLLVLQPRMLATRVPRSRTAERQSLLTFVTLQKGVYEKTGVDRSVYNPADV